ncbi:rod shape-determining protein MreC [Phenylobacterium sp. J426]|uniref:rod shape-determining protein MreC n=1 Tax=Phenylobacterium sp. J426 TaxID=2898439 RepID=UPI0021510820|nr:rod shape-determining protein MreC [Phenylobacterium sp. J426]MCR5876344.1 rod shape-determining protein MreC [Phenylobacterium sp. J426]
MSLRDNPLGELKVPLTWTAGIVFIVVLIATVAILLSDRREAFETDAYGRTRTATDKALEPVGNVLSAPGRWTGAGFETVRGYFFAVSENRRLKAELKEMRQWRDVAIALRDNNERYRALLGLKTDPPIPMVAARIVTDSRGPFANSRLANIGSEAGVKIGHPVMSENGLVGRVVGVTDGVSRVLMLTDVASRTPVMIDRTNARAILAGDGGPNPRLEYLRGQEPVRDGDRVLTSGDGGVFPRGLPVGRAVKGLDGRWRVVLASDRAPIDYVRILLFEDFTQLANRSALDRTAAPPPTPGAPTLPPPEAAPATTGAPPAAAAPPATTTAAPATTTPAPKTTAPAPKTAAPTPTPKAAAPAPSPAAPAPKTSATPPAGAGR